MIHGFLLLIFLFGSAFFPARKPEVDPYPMMRVVPDFFKDGKSGGGGDPSVPLTNDKKKGDPNAANTPKPVETKVAPPTPAPPAPKPEVKLPPETKKEPKADPIKTAPPVPKIAKDPLDLKPVVRKNTAESEAKAKAAAAKVKAEADAAKADREFREAGKKLAQQVGKMADGLQRGFSQGTAIKVGGDGGAAYGDYSHYVKEIYDDAWNVGQDFALDNGVATVKVTIARDGHVVRAVIVDRSGNRPMDLSVQRALDKVTKLPPFPAEIKEEQRTFTIEFNLRAKRSA